MGDPRRGTGGHLYRLFGRTVASECALPCRPAAPGAVPELEISCSRDPLEPTAETIGSPVYASPAPAEGADSWLRLYRHPRHDILRFAGLGDFYLARDRIVYHSTQGSAELPQICLLGTVLAYWHEIHGARMLHASAVVIDDRAAAFLGGKGAGKSSIAATLMQAGSPLLTDDLLCVRSAADGFLAASGYPQMRMWPEQAKRFVSTDQELERVHPHIDKRRVPVTTGGVGRFSETSHRLAAIYRLESRPPDEAEGRPVLSSYSPRDAVVELLRFSFIPALVEAAGLQPERLDFFARLAAAVPIKTIRYPRSWDSMPLVRQAILEDLARGDDRSAAPLLSSVG